MNPLNQYPKARKVAYAIQWVVNGIMGIIGIILTANYGLDGVPAWYVTANLVFNFVWTYTGLTAQSNVSDPDA